jgi:hypothetical protein
VLSGCAAYHTRRIFLYLKAWPATSSPPPISGAARPAAGCGRLPAGRRRAAAHSAHSASRMSLLCREAGYTPAGILRPVNSRILTACGRARMVRLARPGMSPSHSKPRLPGGLCLDPRVRRSLDDAPHPDLQPHPGSSAPADWVAPAQICAALANRRTRAHLAQLHGDRRLRDRQRRSAPGAAHRRGSRPPPSAMAALPRTRRFSPPSSIETLAQSTADLEGVQFRGTPVSFVRTISQTIEGVRPAGARSGRDALRAARRRLVAAAGAAGRQGEPTGRRMARTARTSPPPAGRGTR